MKKLILALFIFFSILGYVEASDNFASFKIDGKDTDQIKVEKNDTFKITLSINKKRDFDVFVVLGKLDYDKELLELVNIEGLNDFIITKGKNILADRYESKEKDVVDVFELEFKVLKTKKTTINFDKIHIANTEEEVLLDGASIECVTSINYFNILLIGVIGIVIIIVIICVIKKKTRKLN